VAAAKAGIEKKDTDAMYARLKENPFNSARKMMSVLVATDKSNLPLFRGVKFAGCVKGAPNKILDRCNKILVGPQATKPLDAVGKAAILKGVCVCVCLLFAVCCLLVLFVCVCVFSSLQKVFCLCVQERARE